MITGRTRIAGVIGSPVTHSLSPYLMNSWIAQAGLDAAYIALPAGPDFNAGGFRALSDSGLAGLNVTLPFKTLALDAADKASEAASIAGAANLLVFRDGKIEADNTDIAGIIAALADAGSDLKDKTVLLIGAGGVARAICGAAEYGQAAQVLIANRTRERAEELAGQFAHASVSDWENRQEMAGRADIIINATSLGLDGQSGPGLDWQKCREGTIVFDTVYTPARRPLMEGARAAGLKTIDGLAMLIGQARPSFTAFFGAPPPEIPDLEHRLREALPE